MYISLAPVAARVRVTLVEVVYPAPDSIEILVDVGAVLS
jgi:hypothetical protein